MYTIITKILDVINSFQNKNVPIHERVCFSPPPYYLDWFEISHPNVNLNWDDGTFFLQCMDEIQVTKPAGQQWNRLLDAVFIIIKYKKITIDNFIYIKVFSTGTVSYLIVSTDDVLNTTNNET